MDKRMNMPSSDRKMLSEFCLSHCLVVSNAQNKENLKVTKQYDLQLTLYRFDFTKAYTAIHLQGTCLVLPHTQWSVCVAVFSLAFHQDLIHLLLIEVEDPLP